MQFSLSLDEKSVVARLRDRLLVIYGPQRDREHAGPLDLFVYAMIASQTRDETSWAAFEALRRHFPAWDRVKDADPREIERIIFRVTYADVKARNLRTSLRMIAARYGRLDLDFLADQEVEAALQCLVALPGVGPKIAAATLNFSSLRKRALVVDMHLLRVGERLGWLLSNPTSETGYDRYMRLMPDDWDGDDLYELHWLIKRHSRQVCAFVDPDCERCVLRDLCSYGSTAGESHA